MAIATREVLSIARAHLEGLAGHEFEILDISAPKYVAGAVELAKVISKLSPLLGNLIEINTVEILNQVDELKAWGTWKRQDPGFPDTVYEGRIRPRPGIEIKAWCPLATEITARFRDSRAHFVDGNIDVAILAWLPECVVYGKPRVLGVVVVPASSVAEARDTHYHNPPDYLVVEPEDTSSRAVNLRQTNTAGYKWQGSASEFARAKAEVAEWGPRAQLHSSSRSYQLRLRGLMARYPYRLDTNFAKIDRIEHAEIERFKARILGLPFAGSAVKEWAAALAGSDADRIASALTQKLGLKLV